MTEAYSNQMPITPPDNTQRLPNHGDTLDNDGLQGPFLVIEGDRPPDIVFDNVNTEQFLPTTSVIETTDDARLRTGLRNIAEQIDDPETAQTYLSPSHRDKKRTSAKTFFATKVPINERMVKREELIDLDTAVSHVVARLMDDNDPVTQYISQLIDELREKEDVNVGALNAFLRSLLIVTHWTEFRTACKEQIEDKKHGL
ncbi:MAG TPA: hypothetical protein PKB09_02260 [Candidatus Saccharibacteria bacterium]|nr:hypothetical protein [Candidatus Saccharibacteria bacterium]